MRCAGQLKAVTLSVQTAAGLHLVDDCAKPRPSSKRGVWVLRWATDEEVQADDEGPRKFWRETRALRSTSPRWLQKLEYDHDPRPTQPSNGHHEAVELPGCTVTPPVLMGVEVRPLRRGKRSRTHATLNRATVEPRNPADN
jgi:hypothetical protein